MFIILTLITLVAAFNIAATLIMIVMRKTKEIGILKSMGASNKDIMNIFIIQGVTTGIIGALLGLAAGVGICIYLKLYPISMPGGGSVYYIDKLSAAHPRITPKVYVIIYHLNPYLSISFLPFHKLLFYFPGQLKQA